MQSQNEIKTILFALLTFKSSNFTVLTPRKHNMLVTKAKSNRNFSPCWKV